MQGSIRSILGGLFFAVISSHSAAQGFLEMPDLIEVPELERETMVQDLDIPSVRERDPDPQGGPRLYIKEFRLQGVVEFPELGITRADIIKQVENIRFDMMQEGSMTESGFSLEELGELSSLIVELEKETQDRHVGPLEVQRLVFLVREQLRRRGITLGMMETIADTITTYYRERGFILAKAYIPKQQVRDGVVTLTLLLGELGGVEVEDNNRASTALVQRAFKSQVFEPVTSDRIDEALYLVNDIPGLRAQGFFSPGSQVGDTKMTVKVQEEQWWTANLRVDNHGSEETSENRVYADFYLHNPLGIGDELYLSVLNTFSPDSSTYGAVRYNSMLYYPRLRASIGASTNDFVSRAGTNTAVFFTGESTVADAGLTWHFRRSRKTNISSSLTYQNIQTELNIFEALNQQDQNKVSLAFNYDLLNEKLRQLYVGSLAVHTIDNESDSNFGATNIEDSITYLTFDATTLAFFRFPFTEYQTRLLVKNSLQYAGKPLSNLNQFSLAGASRARAFAVNSAQADDAFFTSIDWIFGLPRSWETKLFGSNAGRVFQPYIFLDGAYGVRHPLNEGEEELTDKLANAGVGLRLNFAGFSANVTYSQPFVDELEGFTSDTERKAVYAEIQYSFR